MKSNVGNTESLRRCRSAPGRPPECGGYLDVLRRKYDGILKRMHVGARPHRQGARGCWSSYDGSTDDVISLEVMIVMSHRQINGEFDDQIRYSMRDEV